MINRYEVYETNQMIAEENLDVRTITLGISLLDCIDADLDKLNENIYNKITTVAKDLVKTGEEIKTLLAQDISCRIAKDETGKCGDNSNPDRIDERIHRFGVYHELTEISKSERSVGICKRI